MPGICFFDLDGTLRETKSGATFINDPNDQQPIAGAQEMLTHYSDKGFTCIGITNQGGCASINPATGKMFKSIADTILEQQLTLELFPELSEIFFCPNYGESCYRVSRGNEPLIFFAPIARDGLVVSCRKPGHGMLLVAAKDLSEFDNENCCMIGDRPEDQNCALTAGIDFAWAINVRAKFID